MLRPSAPAGSRPVALLALLAALALPLATLLAPTAPASAAVTYNGVFSVPYDSTLYEASARQDSVRAISAQRWDELGRVVPTPIPTDFVKYPWSGTVYAVSFFGPERGDWIWKQLTAAEWARAGYPAPRDVAWVQDSVYYGYGTSTELFVRAPDGSIHKLTGEQWRAAGSPRPATHPDGGFLRLSWDSTIFSMSSVAKGSGQTIGYAAWSAYAFPTPRIVTRIPGDEVYTVGGASDVWYHTGAGLTRKITLAEWRAMGSPAPVRK